MSSKQTMGRNEFPSLNPRNVIYTSTIELNFMRYINMSLMILEVIMYLLLNTAGSKEAPRGLTLNMMNFSLNQLNGQSVAN